MNKRFEDKSVLILGGNSGIGLAAAQLFAAEGARVMITGRNEQTLEAAQDSIDGSFAMAADIADLDATDTVMEHCREWLGELDVLFINAGVGGFAPIDQVTPEFWDDVHSVNLRGCFFALQKALPLLKDGASVVMTGSIGSVAAVPGNAAYAAAKAGMRAMARIAAKELVGRKIRVNVVSPGPTDTPLINRNPGMSDADVAALRELMNSVVPLGRMGTAEEQAKAVLFLASDDASFITGVDLMVDGGAVELS